MRRVEQLIDIARKLSQNTRYDADSGVPQDVFVQFANNAQDQLIKEITNLKTKYFRKEEIIPVVPGQSNYSYPTDCLVNHIDTIQWADSISNVYFQTLYKSYPKERVTTTVGYPFGYTMYRDYILFNPPINTGLLYFTYTAQPRQIQKRAGTITSRTINGSNQLTALTVATTGAYDETEINSDYFLCVVDKFGTLKASNIEYTSVAAGVFTISPFTLAAGDTVTVGDSILVGQNKVNVPTFPDLCESYFIKHMVYDAKYNDSSTWSQEAKADMAQSFRDLSGIFATLSDDLTDIQISNLDFIGF